MVKLLSFFLNCAGSCQEASIDINFSHNFNAVKLHKNQACNMFDPVALTRYVGAKTFIFNLTHVKFSQFFLCTILRLKYQVSVFQLMSFQCCERLKKIVPSYHITDTRGNQVRLGLTHPCIVVELFDFRFLKQMKRYETEVLT